SWWRERRNRIHHQDTKTPRITISSSQFLHRDQRSVFVEKILVIGEVGLEFLEGVAAEFLDKRASQNEGNHRLRDDGGGRHNAGIAAFEGRLKWFLRDEVNRHQRLAQGGHRFHVHANS